MTEKKFGEGEILSCDDKGNVEISFANAGAKKFSMPAIIGRGFAKTVDGKAEECLAEYARYLKDENLIAMRVEYTGHMLEPYKEYLD